MKSALTTILIFSFFSIAIFGVFAMAHTMNSEHGGCIAATSRGEACPGESSVLQSITYHLNSFRGFSSATIGDNLLDVLLLLFALSLVTGFWVFRDIGLTLPIFAASQSHRQLLESHTSSFQRELTHWLSLHENSPASI